jgi:hypothetical protein
LVNCVSYIMLIGNIRMKNKLEGKCTVYASRYYQNICLQELRRVVISEMCGHPQILLLFPVLWVLLQMCCVLHRQIPSLMCGTWLLTWHHVCVGAVVPHCIMLVFNTVYQAYICVVSFALSVNCTL